MTSSSELEINLTHLKDLFTKITDNYQKYTTIDQFNHTQSWFYSPELSIPPSENEKSQNFRTSFDLQNRIDAAETKFSQNTNGSQKEVIERELSSIRRDVDPQQAEQELVIQKEWEELVKIRTQQYQDFIQICNITRIPLEGAETAQTQQGVRKYRQDVVDFVKKLEFNKIDNNVGKLQITESPVPPFINKTFRPQIHAIEPIDVAGYFK
ncbi:hypothetical protein SS50377_20036 [Spironucleus salmonicida]|uniref:Uncharacterized protein n=1 Tax=Spironucleus salmonicida TaxID=348837 RepID=V6LXW4_9EUKA|nr:hypothetical protein SS50377_20036 [Spironucleus salmonicida]|eukprot:EST49395.1 Hypothetical protein SS50377_10320 [Spironucleus salmonicida]